MDAAEYQHAVLILFFRPDLHPGLRCDTGTRVSANPQPRSHLAGLLPSERQLLANPSFNDPDRFRKANDLRWQFGVSFDAHFFS